MLDYRYILFKVYCNLIICTIQLSEQSQPRSIRDITFVDTFDHTTWVDWQTKQLRDLLEQLRQMFDVTHNHVFWLVVIGRYTREDAQRARHNGCGANDNFGGVDDWDFRSQQIMKWVTDEIRPNPNKLCRHDLCVPAQLLQLARN